MTRKKKTRVQPLSTGKTQQQSIQAYQAWLSVEDFELLNREIMQPLAPAFRINPLKTQGDFADSLQNKYGWKLEPVPFCPSGYRVNQQEGPPVSSTLEHRLGQYYVQEVASMLPVELFTLPAGEQGISLDLAASPGGKTTHLVSRLQDRGLVIANDSSQGRIQALRVVLQNWGSVNNTVTCFPGEKFGTWFPEVFDRVLLDAPCSMQGLRVADSHPVRSVTEKESLQLSSRQAALLRSALQAVKVEGEVVYSTCTLLPQEDELVVDAILKEFKGRVEILDAQKFLPLPAPGLTHLADTLLEPGLERSVRLWPHRYHTAGFFACLLRKTTQFDSKIIPLLENETPRSNQVNLTDKEMIAFSGRFLDQYGFDLLQECESRNLLLTRHYEKIFLTPSSLQERFPGLYALSSGMLLGEESPDGFLPSFEWVSRFGIRCLRNVISLDNRSAHEWMNGKNIPLEGTQLAGATRFRIVTNQDGQPLGCGKIVGEGLKNLLPRRMIYSSSSS